MTTYLNSRDDVLVADMVRLLQERASRLGDKQLFRFIAGDGTEQDTITYASLHQRASLIAAELLERADSGSRVLLLYPPGLEFISAFFGCLYAGMIAVPASIPRRRRPADSLSEIIRVAGPSLVLSTADHCQEMDRFYSSIDALAGCDWIASDQLQAEAGHGFMPSSPDPGDLAFLQFTSGSTVHPKGVMVTHDNLLQNLELIHQSFGTSEDSRAVIWLPLYHDMGLIGGVLEPIYCGGTGTLMAPVSFIHSPKLWLQTISETRATISGGPDFAYDLCARKLTQADREQLDLSCWEVAFTGAEPVRAKTLQRFAETFAASGFRRSAFFPCYGLAESTLIVSGGPRHEPPPVLTLSDDSLQEHRVEFCDESFPSARQTVACGELLPQQRLKLVDPETLRECGSGEVGEIWLQGACVARGYFQRADVTAEVFGARLVDSDDGPYLRTGDLGFVHDDQLYVTGRLKDLIIIRGRNYYPDEIEQTVERSSEGLQPGAGIAFSMDIDDQERLIVVQELEANSRNMDLDEAFRSIRFAIADRHELEVHGIVLLRPGGLPRTTSGKKRRSACRDLYLTGELKSQGSWTAAADGDSQSGTVADDRSVLVEPRTDVTADEVASWLRSRIASRLNLPIEHVESTTPFLEFGMGSLDAVEISADLERWLGRRLSPTAVYNHPTIAAMANWLTRQQPAEGDSAPSTARSVTATPALDDEQLRQEIQALSEDEMEQFIQQEMSRLTGVEKKAN